MVFLSILIGHLILLLLLFLFLLLSRLRLGLRLGLLLVKKNYRLIWTSFLLVLRILIDLLLGLLGLLLGLSLLLFLLPGSFVVVERGLIKRNKNFHNKILN
jgi:hypothetical protein